MNPPRCNALDYINFLLATPDVASTTEAARVQPTQANAPAHDAFTRLLHRLEPDPETLWLEARPQVRLAEGVLVLDDTVLDKPHARHIDLVGRHWSGKDERSGLTVLRPNVRKLCFQLLGPAPEHPEYADYWAHKRKDPPAEHQPPGPEEEIKVPPKRRGRGR